MADFRTHVTFSSAIGAGYAVVASGCGFPLSTSLVAGGLCGVSGMLPDVDSDSGVPRREALGFAAAIVPMLLVDRFRQFELAHDQIVLIAAVLYFGIRFTAANLIGRWSVHRGMWHSIPAVLIFAGLAFLISGSEDVFERYLKAAAVGLGSFSHLILDEIYSVDTRGVVPRFKKSFGSAVKFWGKNPTANFSTYTKLAVVVAAILMEPAVLERLDVRNPELADRVRATKQRLAVVGGRLNNGDRVIEESEPSVSAATGQVQTALPTQQQSTQSTLPPSTGFSPPVIRFPSQTQGGFAPNRGGAYQPQYGQPPYGQPQQPLYGQPQPGYYQPR